MAKQLTQQEMQRIKDSVIASCVSKGIKPNSPMYASCVQLGYDDAIKHATQGKLGLWFSKVDSFVQSQGGVTGLMQSIGSIASQYRAGTANPTQLINPGVTSTQFPPGYDGLDSSGKGDNMGLWLVLIILLIVLIIATVIYFNRHKKGAAV